MFYDPTKPPGTYLRELTGEFHKWTHLEDGYGGSGCPRGEAKAILAVLCSGNTHYGILGSTEK